MMRADQLLSRHGFCSRREARAWLRAGRVREKTGSLVADPAARIDPHSITVDGEPVPFPGDLLVMLHKPVETVCTHGTDEGATVYDLLPEQWMRRQPPPSAVGRLDRDTSGLLLVTDRGEWIHQWTSPRNGWEKVYEVTLAEPPSPDWPDRLAAGDLMLRGEDRPCLPARMERLDGNRIRLTLTEGRYHQVKRMAAALGNRVVNLHRVAFGPYRLDDGMKPGQWRAVDPPA